MPLNPETLIYEGRGSPSEIAAELADVAAFDETAERKRRGGCPMALCGLLSGFFLSACLLGVVDRATGSQVVVVVVGAVCFAVLVAAGVRAAKALDRFDREDLENRRYGFAQELLALLVADLSPEAQVELDLDLWPLSAERKKTGPNTTQGYRTVVHVADPWLTLRGRLADGTAFSLQAKDTGELRYHRKSYKHKFKVVTRLALRLRPKAKRYPGLDALAEGAAAAVKLPQGCVLKKLLVEPGDLRITTAIKTKTLGGEPAPGMSWPTLTEAGAAMFLSAYQVLSLSRRAAKRGGQGEE